MNQETFFRIKLAILQLVTALAFGGAVYCQAKVMNALGIGAIDNTILGMGVALLLLYVALELSENYIRERYFYRRAAQIKIDAAGAFFSQSAAKHTQKTEAQHISYFSNEIETVLMQNLSFRLYIQKLFFLVCISLAILFILSWECGILVLFASISASAVVHLISNRLMTKQKRLQHEKSSLVDMIAQLYHGFHEIHVNQMESSAEDGFQAANRAVEQAQYKYRLLGLRLELLGIGQNMLVYILVLIVGGVLASAGKAGIGIFVVIGSLMAQVMGQWSIIMKLYARVRGTDGLKKDLDLYISCPVEPYRKTSIKTPDFIKNNTLLEANCLSFEYSETQKVLHRVNLSLLRGKKYLITGESGSGKSTLLELLAGHLNATEGRLIFHTDRIAYLPQKPFLFQGTLKENLTFEKETNPEKMREFLGKVGLDLSLDAAIEGDGKNLSGGQKALIALVRALLTKPDVILADEVTAELDPVSGEQIERLLTGFDSKMTLCLVAHKVYCPDRYDKKLRVNPQGIVEVIK